MASEATKVPFVEAAAPSTPAANRVVIYAKADGLMYSKDDAGVETLMSGGAGGLTDHDHTVGGDGGDLDSPVIDGYAVFNEESAPGTAGAATVRLYAKSDGLLYSKDDAGIETLVSGGAGGGGGGLLAIIAYAASGDNTISVTTTSDADVDATNLQITFTAPASGNVLVKLSSLYNDGNNNSHWTVREGSTTLGDSYVSSQVNKAIRGNASIYISGISAGSHTYKFGAYTSAGTMSIYHGTTASLFGKIVMEVWAAP